jgi:tape measure domain-containing protein
LGRSFIDASDLESANTRIDNLVKNFSQFTGIQDLATQSAQKFRLSQVEALSALTDLGNRLGGTGASLKDIENIFEGFNTLLVNNKVEAQQAASAQLQLNQALGSGRLAGEEFNAINEATPQLLDEVARVLGVQRGELKKLASDGKISSQVLIQALTNIRTQGAADLEGAFSGSFGALRNFNVALKEFSTTVGQELLPVITPLLKEATKLLKLFGELPEPVRKAAVGITLVGTAAVFAIPLITATAGALVKVAAAIGTLKLGAAAAGVGKLALAFVGLKAAILATPFVAAGAALVGLTGLTISYYNEQRELNKLLKGGSDELSDYEKTISKFEKKATKAAEKLKNLKEKGISNARAINAQRKALREYLDIVEKLKDQEEIIIRIRSVESRTVPGRNTDAGGGGFFPSKTQLKKQAEEDKKQEERAKKLADLRFSLERQVRDLRRDQFREALAFEKRIAEERISTERSIAQARREAADTRALSRFDSQIAAARLRGEDTTVLEAAKESERIRRDAINERIRIAENAEDRRRQLDKNLEEFKNRQQRARNDLIESTAQRAQKLLNEGGDGVKRELILGAERAKEILESINFPISNFPSEEVGGQNLRASGSKGQALIDVGKRLGVNPLDLATIIEFESGGRPDIVGGAGDNYQGLIQFGPEERQRFGANTGQSFEEQLRGPVVKFLEARFRGVGRTTQGADISDLYATVLAGNPNANKNSPDAFGTTVNSAVRDKFPAIRQRALEKYFDGQLPSQDTAPPAPQLPKPVSPEIQQGVDGATNKAKELSDTQQIAELEKLRVETNAKLIKQSNQLKVNGANILQPIRSQLESADKRNAATERTIQLLKKGVNPELARAQASNEQLVKSASDQLDIQIVAAKGLANEKGLAKEVKDARLETVDALVKEKALLPDILNGLNKRAEKTKELADQEKKIREEQATLNNLYRGIGDTIENGIIGAIDAGINSLIDGTKSLDKALQEIASGVLKDIGNQLIRFGVNAALSGLGNSGGFLGKLFGGGRAEGGSVSPDKTFLVGEKGPELFTPTTSGTIIPNDFFDSARAALQPSNGDSAAADNPEAFAAAAAAIQRNTTNINNRQSAISQETSFNNFAETLGSQQRETIRFETVRVGEIDMVTKDEALKIGAESAKAAEASVFNALKNKPSVRKSIGMS